MQPGLLHQPASWITTPCDLGIPKDSKRPENALECLEAASAPSHFRFRLDDDYCGQETRPEPIEPDDEEAIRIPNL